MSSFGSKLLEVFANQGHLCVGIDPSPEQLSSWGLPVSAQGAKSFALEVLGAAHGYVGIVKPQVSFFEQFGAEGFQVLSEVLELAKAQGFLVIADAKRGDIGSSMAGYSRAWLSGEAVFICDALTVSPYLGSESLDETVSIALANSRGVFVLAATSNLEATRLQSAKKDGESIAQSVVYYAGGHREGELGSIGVVVGATVSAVEVGVDFSKNPGLPVLVPGFGTQGAELIQARTLLSSFSDVSICSVSRSVAGFSSSDVALRIAAAKAELEVGLRA